MLEMLCLLTFTSPKSIVVDLKHFTWVACESGRVIKSGPASGGRTHGCIEKTIPRKSCRTPTGNFNVIVKKGKYYRSPTYPMTKVGDKYIPCKKEKCAKMSFGIKFHYLGAFIHASNDRLDRHTSHSCVHVGQAHAEWINQYSYIGMPVVILPY